MSNARVDVVVIGAGAIGLATARALVGAGRQVQVLAVSYTHLTLPTILLV